MGLMGHMRLMGGRRISPMCRIGPIGLPTHPARRFTDKPFRLIRPRLLLTQKKPTVTCRAGFRNYASLYFAGSQFLRPRARPTVYSSGVGGAVDLVCCWQGNRRRPLLWL